MELKAVFDQIQAAEKAGNMSPEDKQRLEEQAAEKGLQALFKVSLSTIYIHSRELTWDNRVRNSRSSLY